MVSLIVFEGHSSKTLIELEKRVRDVRSATCSQGVDFSMRQREHPVLLHAIGSHHLLYARQGDEAIELVFQRLHTSLCSAKPLSKAALAPYDTFAIFRPNNRPVVFSRSI